MIFDHILTIFMLINFFLFEIFFEIFIDFFFTQN